MNIKYLVTTKEWRDRINGNTYFASQIENLENGTIKKIPFQYGYGTQSEYVCKNHLGFEVPINDWVKEDGIIEQEIINRLIEASDNFMAERAVKFGVEIFRQAEKTLLLQVLDQGWKDHLLVLDQLRQSIGLRAYGQKDPLNEYKRESFELFEDMLDKLRKTITSILSNIQIEMEQASEQEDSNVRKNLDSSKKIQRNAICPLCDSGKKYKHCCGRL